LNSVYLSGRSLPAPARKGELELGVAGFTFGDLFEPARLSTLHDTWDAWFRGAAPEAYAKFDAYRACRGKGMTPSDVSEALLVAAPFVSGFIARLFRVEADVSALSADIRDRDPLWLFKRDFAKKRVLKADAGKGWEKRGASLAEAGAVALAAYRAALSEFDVAAARDEELAVSRATHLLFEVDDVARKAAKAGGAQWTDELRARAGAVRASLAKTGVTSAAKAAAIDGGAAPTATDTENAQVVAFALDAIEASLAARLKDRADPAHRWPSLHAPKNIDFEHLVEIRRDPDLAERFVGPEHERRQRADFALTDRRMNGREAEQEIDYCLFCHERDKDSCAKGLIDAKTAAVKKNPLGVLLEGCPLDEKISEMHLMRKRGDVLAALALVCIDNPLLPGTGHRICNDCMKACIFQKQEPVNIPQIETRMLTEALSLPWGLEIYGLLTRWNPLNVERPVMKPYNGRDVLVVGLGPAGYTLAHHLACEGFGVVAVDGLKIEPLPADVVGEPGKTPPPIRDYSDLYLELDERVLLGFGGVSEYGITVRWDKNFLTVLYVTLARNRLLKMYGGVRFGGTVTLEDAWELGFDHVAIAAGAGRPTIIDMKNNLARGIRKASDFLMALQLTGAYKKSSLANLQVRLPAIVIGGGLTAIDTATELLAYYLVQVEKTAERFAMLEKEKPAQAIRAMFDDEEWALLQEYLAHAKELAEEKARAEKEGRVARVQHLLDKWGGVSLVYRKSVNESPAYRLNHEEVIKSLEEGVRYLENLAPEEAIIDELGCVKALKFSRKDKSIVELPARTVCVAAGTSPNTMYEKEYSGTFLLDAKKQFFLAHTAALGDDGKVTVEPAAKLRDGFFTSYLKAGKTVSFYGDNHPHYAGSVVKAMASARDGYPRVAALFPDVQKQDPAKQPERDAKLANLFARLDDELVATTVAVNRLTETIVEVVVRAPRAARKFHPGQFYRLQNFETFSHVVEGTRLSMEGLALTGAWVDKEKGLLGTIVLEMGGSSRLCAALKPGEPIVLMGPTGAPTEIAPSETVLLCGGGLGNAVLFSIARAFKGLGSRVLYFAGYKRGEDLFKQDDIEAYTDQVIWTTDGGVEIQARRPQDAHFRGNIVQAMVAYGKGELGQRLMKLDEVHRIIAIGSDRMMAAVKEARHGVLEPFLSKGHRAIGSINSPMQCMMKEVCAQCLQKHRDPETGKETIVFSCFNQDQELDRVDFPHLRQRLRANSLQEKLSNVWLDRLLAKNKGLLRV
jgi:NADPH-dependent glutamate synthase beta subunit-like oxidoreductase/NAD(P)H-flavin reductase